MGVEGTQRERPGTVMADAQYQEKMLRVLRKYNNVRQNNMLLLLPFTTITDYLHELYGPFLKAVPGSTN